MPTLVAGCGKQAKDTSDEDAKNAAAQAGPAEDSAPQEDAQKSKDTHEPQGKENHIQIQMTVNGTAFTATLDEGTAGTEFHACLPLTLAMDDLHGNEKYCYTCSRVCPMGCIRIEDGKPVYDYVRCANCFGCIQACPKKALRFADFDEPNPSARYRNPHVSLADLVRANNQLQHGRHAPEKGTPM